MSTVAANVVQGRLLQDVSMDRYCSWRAGGKAKILFFPNNLKDLLSFIEMLDGSLPIHLIGLGSNLLVRDGGIDAAIVRAAPGLSAINTLEEKVIYAEAGVAMPKLAKYAAKLNLGGAGFMASIPGSVGGALAMNAGCYGTSTWQRVQSATMLDEAGNIIEANASDFDIGYRKVSHKTNKKLAFIAAKFNLPEEKPNEREQDSKMMAAREATQPIGTANAGSVFINPEGDSAGRLVEAANLAGKKVGNAQVSQKHCNFIINNGGATASDIEDLIELVVDNVYEKSGVKLQPEVRIIGKRS